MSLNLREKGVTLIEMLFSIVIILTLSTAFYQLIISFNHHYEVQDAVAAMQQEGRVSADLFIREIRNAGLDPKGGLFDPSSNKKTKDRKVYMADLDPPACETKKHPVERVLEATSTSVQFLADLNGDNSVDDPREHIRYEWVGSPSIDLCGHPRSPDTLYRETGSGMQEVASNIASFNLSYFDEDGTQLFFDIENDGEADPLLKTQRESIRRIVIDLTARAGKKDSQYPENNGYRTRSFSADIRFKNL